MDTRKYCASRLYVSVLIEPDMQQILLAFVCVQHCLNFKTIMKQNKFREQKDKLQRGYKKYMDDTKKQFNSNIAFCFKYLSSLYFLKRLANDFLITFP